MGTASRSLARASMATALAFVFLYLGSVLPSGRLALLCVASLSVVFVLLSCSRRWALGCYAAASLLSLLLLPQKGMALLFASFAGYYPVVKLRAERLRSAWLRWGVKLLIFNAAFAAVYLLSSGVFSLSLGERLPVWLLFAAANIAFLLYDWAMTCCILLYSRKIAGRIK